MKFSFVCFYCVVTIIRDRSFSLSLHLNCLLPVFFHPSLLDGDMYAIIIAFFHMRVSHQASIKQSRKKESTSLFTCQERKGGGKKYEIELMCCWFVWKHKTVGDTFGDSWKFIETQEHAPNVDLDFSPRRGTSPFRLYMFMAFFK